MIYTIHGLLISMSMYFKSSNAEYELFIINFNYLKFYLELQYCITQLLSYNFITYITIQLNEKPKRQLI